MAAGHVFMVERARNEPDELKNSHETVISAQTPFLTPVLAGQGSSFIKSCSGIKYQAFSVDYFISTQLDLNHCINKVVLLNDILWVPEAQLVVQAENNILLLF
jgi:hypothetical protein